MAKKSKQRKTEQDNKANKGAAPAGSYIIPIKLQNCWHETISRKEALRRLATRNLDPEKRAKIEKEIPEQTEHYLTFHGHAFREYADFGTGVASLVLLLPVQKKGKKFIVLVPVFNSDKYPDGRTKRTIGIELHEYEVIKGKLVENGKPRDTFKFSKGPMDLNVWVDFVTPNPDPKLLGGHPGGSFCCDACEWVHSALDIHCADWTCCLGCCDLQFIPKSPA